MAEVDSAHPAVEPVDEAIAGETFGQKLRRNLGFRNISAIWILVGIIIVFSILIPQKFLVPKTWGSVLDNQAVIGITAIALIIPLAAGVFNLAIGLQVGAGSIVIAWLLVTKDLPLPVALVIAGICGILIGVFSAWLIVQVRIDSFIATLGVSSLLAAFITAISGGQQILGLPEGIQNFVNNKIFGITYSVVLLIVVAFIVWYLLERTPSGRRVYATGGNIDAARLSGVNTTAVIYGSLAACGLLTALAGVVLSAKLGNADPTIGPGYLVPAFTAAFLGSTQFKQGRFNVWGTLVSAFVLAIGVKGLQLWGAPIWIPDAFNGFSLLVAVGLAKYQRNNESFRAIRRSLRMEKSTAATATAGD